MFKGAICKTFSSTNQKKNNNHNVFFLFFMDHVRQRHLYIVLQSYLISLLIMHANQLALILKTSFSLWSRAVVLAV